MKAREHVKHRPDNKTESRTENTYLSWNVNQAANELLHQMISRLKWNELTIYMQIFMAMGLHCNLWLCNWCRLLPN